MVQAMLNECMRMSEFDHPNVLTLIGVCLDGGPAPFIIMPYMANGSLLCYLRENRESLVISPLSNSDLHEEQVQVNARCTLYLIRTDRHAGHRCSSPASDEHVCSSGKGNGVSCQAGNCSQRLGSKKLHVRQGGIYMHPNSLLTLIHHKGWM